MATHGAYKHPLRTLMTYRGNAIYHAIGWERPFYLVEDSDTTYYTLSAAKAAVDARCEEADSGLLMPDVLRDFLGGLKIAEARLICEWLNHGSNAIKMLELLERASAPIDRL